MYKLTFNVLAIAGINFGLILFLSCGYGDNFFFLNFARFVRGSWQTIGVVGQGWLSNGAFA